MLTDQDILNHPHVGEETDILKGSCYASLHNLSGLMVLDLLPFKYHRSSVHLIYTGQHIVNRCFSGTVRTNDANDLPLFYFKRYLGNSLQASEYFCDSVYFQQCHCLTRSFPPLSQRAVLLPWGGYKDALTVPPAIPADGTASSGSGSGRIPQTGSPPGNEAPPGMRSEGRSQ